MISNDIKTRIVLAISGNRQNYATDANTPSPWAFRPLTARSRKATPNRNLSDAKWMSIARRLGVSLRRRRGVEDRQDADFRIPHFATELCWRKEPFGHVL